MLDNLFSDQENTKIFSYYHEKLGFGRHVIFLPTMRNEECQGPQIMYQVPSLLQGGTGLGILQAGTL